MPSLTHSTRDTHDQYAEFLRRLEIPPESHDRAFRLIKKFRIEKKRTTLFNKGTDKAFATLTQDFWALKAGEIFGSKVDDAVFVEAKTPVFEEMFRFMRDVLIGFREENNAKRRARTRELKDKRQQMSEVVRDSVEGQQNEEKELDLDLSISYPSPVQEKLERDTEANDDMQVQDEILERLTKLESTVSRLMTRQSIDHGPHHGLDHGMIDDTDVIELNGQRGETLYPVSSTSSGDESFRDTGNPRKGFVNDAKGNGNTTMGKMTRTVTKFDSNNDAHPEMRPGIEHGSQHDKVHLPLLKFPHGDELAGKIMGLVRYAHEHDAIAYTAIKSILARELPQE